MPSETLAHVREYAANALLVLSDAFDLDPALMIRVLQPGSGEDALWRFPESTVLPKVYGTPPVRITVGGVEYRAYALWPKGYALAFLVLVLLRTAHIGFAEAQQLLDTRSLAILREYSGFMTDARTRPI